MNLPVGETCVLSTPAILWRKYPCGRPYDGISYQIFSPGSTLIVVGEQDWFGRLMIYLMDSMGDTFVAPNEYLALRTKLLR